ncbi:DUF378 domain-containing protein [Patescibacteria group bacterium]|nr:DUF378 domain-containing protein [Patescibacteria group bacterium]
MCGVHVVAWVLLIIGGLNWGLVGAFDLNIVELVLGGVPWLLDLTYILIGLSAVAMLFCKSCKKCKVGKGKGGGGLCPHCGK